MEINYKNYQESEFGLIPKEWEVKEIDHFIDLLTGFPFPSQGYSNSGIKLLRGSNIKRGNIDWNQEITEYWPSLTPELREYILLDGDIVISMDGSLVGRSFARLTKNDLPALLLQRVARIRSSKIDMGYLKEFICSSYFTKYCDSVKTSSAIPHISPKDIKDFRIPIPPKITEQTAIATALSDMDALIAQTEKLIEKKKAIKQGVMQELLRPKKGWVTKKLGDVANCFAGGTPSTFNRGFWGGKIPWLPSGRVKNKIIKPIENEITITDLGLSSSAAKMIKPNSILIAITGATCGNIGLLTFSAAANQSVVAIEKNDNFDSVLIYYILLTMRDDILRLQTGSAQGGVNLKSVKSLEVIIPEKTEEQNEISQILWDFDKEIETYIEKLSKLKLQKQGMMQALLTGKIRLV